MKKIYYFILILSFNLYSQSQEDFELFNDCIKDGKTFVNEGIKNKMSEKIYQGIKTFKKARDYAHIKSLGIAQENIATKEIEKATKEVEKIKTAKIIPPKPAVPTTIAINPTADSKKNKYNELINQSIPIYYSYAELLLEKNKIQEAKEVYSKILAIKDTPQIRDEIATIYLNKTGVSYFKELFLSNSSKIYEYRSYFIYTKPIDSLNNAGLLEYYSNLVDLDLEYLKTKPSTAALVEIQISTHYNNLGWFSLLCKKFENTLDYFNKSIKYSQKHDIKNDAAKGNIPHAYLFNNKVEEAKKLYLSLKDKSFINFGSSNLVTYKDAFLDDFKSFREAGISNKDMDEIQALIEK